MISLSTLSNKKNAEAKATINDSTIKTSSTIQSKLIENISIKSKISYVILTRIIIPIQQQFNIQSKQLYYNKFQAISKQEEANAKIINYEKGFRKIKQSNDNIKECKIIKEIGAGSNASVKYAKQCRTGRYFAIKIYPKYKLLQPNKLRALQKQIKVMSFLDHPFIIKLHKAVEDKRQIHLIMEYSGNQTLTQYFRKKFYHLQQYQTKFIFKCIVQAIKYLHDLNIVHRDIKIDNILYNQSIKLIDFGFSTKTNEHKICQFFCGTLNYMSPQIIIKKPYEGKPADVWALGILLYYLSVGKYPFVGYNEKELQKKIISGQFFLPSNINQHQMNLIKSMLNVETECRPSCNQILSSQWFDLY